MKKSTHASSYEPSRESRDRVRAFLTARYDQMWSKAIGRIRMGQVEQDPVLKAEAEDQRRGLTVIARPSLAVRRRIMALLDQWQELEPAQYYYAASEFHLTVLSLFAATTEPEPFLAQTPLYISIVNEALRSARPIHVEFLGVTASSGTVMIQGFLRDDALNRLRDNLRARLQSCGLGEHVDQRYRLQTAHMTVVRFRAPLRDAGRFAAVLERARERPFGTMTIRDLALVKNDWYMSRRVTETLKHYHLAPRE